MLARKLPFLVQEPSAFLIKRGDLAKEVKKKLDLSILIKLLSMPLVNEIPPKKNEVTPETFEMLVKYPDYFKWLFLKNTTLVYGLLRFYRRKP